MFSDLPQSLQKEVFRYLETDNFKTAKQLHDDWMAQQQNNHQPTGCKKKEMNILIWASVMASSVGNVYQILNPMMQLFF